MKKLFSIVFLFAFCLVASAQYTTPRFGTTPNSDNTGRVLTYGYVSTAYAASYVVVPKWFDTTVKIGQLTGDITLTANLAVSHVGDRLNLLVSANGSDRTITFSTGFSSGGTLVISANTYASLYFVFNGVGWFQLSGQNLVTGLVGNGSAAAPSLSFTGQTDLGFYKVGAADIGISVGGSKIGDILATGLSLSGNIVTSKANVVKRTGVAINATATATAANIMGGLITSTSAAPTTITLPSVADLVTASGAAQGTTIDFIVDNSAGASTVTIAVGVGMTASGFPSTNTLTLANSATVGTAGFRITFMSGTAATLTRIN